jgi:hypothetical protein
MDAQERSEGTSGEGGDTGLAQVVASQAKVIEELRSRLDVIESRGLRGASERVPGSDPGDEGNGGIRADRRHLLALAGVTAAGAVAGTVMLGAGASPASAETGNFEGNPGVFGTANPGGANGVVGSTISGVGVFGGSGATSGQTMGVQGVTSSPEGIGVMGNNFSSTGQANGVQGYTASTEGVGVSGWAAPETGPTVGVRGSSQSASGFGVEGGNNSPTGNTIGVRGGVSSVTGRGVVGIAFNPSGSGIGVQGDSGAVSGIGVQALAGGQTGMALQALAGGQDGVAVQAGAYHPSGVTTALSAGAVSPQGTAVRAQGATRVEAQSSRTHLRLGRGSGAWPVPPLSAGLARAAGELVFDGSTWWLCVVSGTPGDWREVAGPATAGSLHILPAAVRAYDSRPGSTPTSVVKGRLFQNQVRTIDLRVGGGLPPTGARAALINLTVTSTSSSGGFLKTFKAGTSVPIASAVNWSTGGQTIANSATVAVSSTGGLSVSCGGNGASTDFIVDVAGYYL